MNPEALCQLREYVYLWKQILDRQPELKEKIRKEVEKNESTRCD